MNGLTAETNSIALLKVMRDATHAGLLNWKEEIGSRYRAGIGSRSYALRWLYWYNEHGITIDRQGPIVSAGSIDILLFNGTASQQEARLLLGAIDEKWDSHYLRIAERCVFMLRNNHNLPPLPDLNELHQQVLTTLLEATVRGAMVWRQDADDQNHFASTLHGNPIAIRFYQPADNESRPLDRLVARLCIPGATSDFVCGTEGYSMIERILAEAIPAFRELIITRDQALRTEIDFLQQLLKESHYTRKP